LGCLSEPRIPVFLAVLNADTVNRVIFAVFSFHIFAFSQCSAGIYRAFDGQTEFSQAFNFAVLSTQNSKTCVLKFVIDALMDNVSKYLGCIQITSRAG